MRSIETTWNPTTGCDRITAGCDHCYALTLAKRLQAIGSAKYRNSWLILVTAIPGLTTLRWHRNTRSVSMGCA